VAIAANVDIWNDELIAGWAEGPGEEPVRLWLEIAGRPVGAVTANQYREDLGRAVSFQINISHFPRGLAEQIRLRVEGSDQVFSGQGESVVSEEHFNGMHSLFGGMWIDRADWQEVLAAKLSRGDIDEETAERIRVFVRDGYLVVPQAVSPALLDQLNEDIERVWRQEVPGLMIETFMVEPGTGQAHVVPVEPQYRYGSTKLLDTYSRLASAREASAAPAVVRFLRAIFDDGPRAFQQLHFTMGSQQRIHKDTAYVKVDNNAMALVATWLALEDIQAGTGELEYYVGSHRSPDYLFGGISKWMEHAPEQHDDFLDSLDRDAERLGHVKSSFLAKAGDVLIWHADLAHGGSAITNPGVTRKSLVTHYTAQKFAPFYMRSHRYPPARVNGVEFTSHYADVLDA
jgi:phytanoyl-CoA hydroxylase